MYRWTLILWVQLKAIAKQTLVESVLAYAGITQCWISRTACINTRIYSALKLPVLYPQQ